MQIWIVKSHGIDEGLVNFLCQGPDVLALQAICFVSSVLSLPLELKGDMDIAKTMSVAVFP